MYVTASICIIITRMRIPRLLSVDICGIMLHTCISLTDLVILFIFTYCNLCTVQVCENMCHNWSQILYNCLHHKTVSANQKDIVKSFMRSNTKGLKFYSYILANDFNISDSLVGRTVLQCRRDGTSLIK